MAPQLAPDLVAYLDLMTPTYKYTVEALPLRERKILSALAQYRAATARVASDYARLHVTEGSVYLNRLVKRKLLRRVGRRKRYVYLFEEPLLCAWLLFRQGRPQLAAAALLP
jgi:hypothetical protein